MIWEKAAEGKGRKDSGWMTLAETLFFLFTAAAAVYESEPEKTDSKKGKNAFLHRKDFLSDSTRCFT